MKASNTELPILSAAGLRTEISGRNQARASSFAHELTWSESPSVLYAESAGVHGNFLPASWKRILAHPAWRKRLAKSYTASRFVPRAGDRHRFELDCAASSDALLMNIFCYPKVFHRPALCALLGIEPGLEPDFGFRPAIPRLHGHVDRTEIDMRLGSLLIEAKLTESDFQRAPLRLLARYPSLNNVFDLDRLPIVNGSVHSWQLIRGVLAAHAAEASFLVFCDRRRPDLIDRWFAVMNAVSSSTLRTRLGLLTWQEISATLPSRLRQFLEVKYGI
jgi:Restriction Endonuclease associating with ARP